MLDNEAENYVNTTLALVLRALRIFEKELASKNIQEVSVQSVMRFLVTTHGSLVEASLKFGAYENGVEQVNKVEIKNV